MGIALLQLHTKSPTPMGDRLRIQLEFIPRVGEMVEIGREYNLPEGNVHYAIVRSVVYRLIGNTLMPFIDAQLGNDRPWILASHGWIPEYNPDDHIEHDDQSTSEQFDLTDAEEEWRARHFEKLHG